jgi:PTH1 family peptidyl-tRNA hydrolase
MIPDKSTSLVIPSLIVGLGNPEDKYERTRHNIGFDAVDSLARGWQFSWQQNRRFQGMFAEGRGPQGSKVLLLKPLTYMNRSGQSVRAVMDWYKLSPESLLVIYDDMDLPLGRLRLRLGGSAGGHNGMKSIISHLGSQNFPRLRIGIGKSDRKTATISHVLGKFAPQEAQLVPQVLQLAVEAVEMSLKQGVQKAMSLYNNRTVELPSSPESQPKKVEEVTS